MVVGRETVPKYIVLLTLVVITTFISGCGSPPLSNKEQEFANIISLPYDDLHDKFRLTIPRGLNDYKFGYPIELELVNDSRDTVRFSSDFGINLFTYDKSTDKWVEINNLVEYLPVGDYELHPMSNDSLGGPVISVYPELQDFTQSITIRVLMVGEVIREGISTNVFAGSYIDITLSP